jgi:hypothetical protein
VAAPPREMFSEVYIYFVSSDGDEMAKALLNAVNTPKGELDPIEKLHCRWAETKDGGVERRTNKTMQLTQWPSTTPDTTLVAKRKLVNRTK